MDYIAQQLVQTSVFNHLPEAEGREMVRLARRMRPAGGDYLLHQGDVWPHVIFLLEGELRWEILSLSGREHVLFTIGPGDVFWGHSLFDDEPMPASLIASRRSEALVWDRETILPFLFGCPQALWDLTQLQVRTMRRAREIIYGLAFQPVSARLAGLLLESFGEQREEATIERDFTLNEVAARVASSPEVVCRILHQFHADGVLELTRAHITLRDPHALNRIVEKG